MFAPKWKKEAKLLYKGANKFLNYKRDLLPEDKIADIEAKRADLLKAVKTGDQKACSAAEKLLTSACDRSLPGYRRQGWLEENIEVFFVAIVVALGIRAYYLQPFRIPTGSMQPTLNGITGTAMDEKDFPGFAKRMTEKVLRGRSYVHEELDGTRTFRSRYLDESIVQVQKFNFFTFTELYFDNGSKISIPAPRNVVLEEFGLKHKLNIRVEARQAGTRRIPVQVIGNMSLEQGTTIASGYVDTGDLVLVDKVSYNFRRPNRGEVWVFDTRGIEEIHKSSGPQGAGSHYIKRLAAVPGDTIQIQKPHLNENAKLYINGKLPREKTLREVMNSEGRYKGEEGYLFADPRTYQFDPALSRGDQIVELNGDPAKGQREYFSLGDNTDNSLDSRYWGPVREYNAVGPALFSLWPITTGHWGFIR